MTGIDISKSSSVPVTTQVPFAKPVRTPLSSIAATVGLSTVHVNAPGSSSQSKPPSVPIKGIKQLCASSISNDSYAGRIFSTARTITSISPFKPSFSAIIFPAPPSSEVWNTPSESTLPSVSGTTVNLHPSTPSSTISPY